MVAEERYRLLPTPAKRLLSTAIIRIASSEAGLQTNCKPVRSRFVGDGLLCRDRLLMEDCVILR